MKIKKGFIKKGDVLRVGGSGLVPVVFVDKYKSKLIDIYFVENVIGKNYPVEKNSAIEAVYRKIK